MRFKFAFFIIFFLLGVELYYVNVSYSLSTETILAFTQNALAENFHKYNRGYLLLGFWFLGLSLAFTPCVLPVLLIMIGFQAHHGNNVSRYKALRLAFVYVIALSFTYAISGLIAGILGIYIQAYLQKPATLIFFSLFFIVLSLSLLGAYNLKIPQNWRRGIVKLNTIKASQNYYGIALMGIVATLIASPCMTAPLAGVLGYISQTGDIKLSILTLFVMGLGIGSPLLITSLIGKDILPKMGPWQEDIKHFFGLLLLGIGISFVERILEQPFGLIIWVLYGFFIIGYFIFYGHDSHFNLLKKILISLILIYSVLFYIAKNTGRSYITEWSNPTQISSIKPIKFNDISNLNEFEQQMQLAKSQQQYILLYFTAAWCETCIKDSVDIFENNQVQQALQNFILLRVDLTNGQINNNELAQHFKIIAPPEILFFTPSGNQVNVKIYDNIEPKQFVDIVKEISKTKN